MASIFFHRAPVQATIILVAGLLTVGEWACTPRRYYGPEAWAQGDAMPEPAGGDQKDDAVVYRLRHKERGIASFMADETHGRKTANGEMYDMRQMVAAHLHLPFNTMVVVRNLNNGREVEVRINDRGPYVKGRIIDLSLEAAKQLGIVEQGSGQVEIEVIALP